MLVHPQGLSEKTQYAIDQFVLRGGKALVFVDPHSEAQALRQQQQPGMPADTASNLDEAAPGLGHRLQPGQRRRRPAGGAPGLVCRTAGATRSSTICPGCRSTSSHLADGEVVTAELNRINLGTAGALAA